MENMKSLADKLREATKNADQAKPSQMEQPEQNVKENINQQSDNRKEVKPKKHQKKTLINSPKIGGDISYKINDLSFEDDSFESITIRFPKKLYSKLKLLSNEKLSVQKTTIYAVNELLESDVIKQKLKSILKSLNE
ncbi:MAG: hypothetical protein M5Z89_02045 [Olivibacter sp.]|nr:hypothetical protein [Olivibacter sp. UJ_SKK_5.1]